MFRGRIVIPRYYLTDAGSIRGAVSKYGAIKRGRRNGGGIIRRWIAGWARERVNNCRVVRDVSSKKKGEKWRDKKARDRSETALLRNGAKHVGMFPALVPPRDENSQITGPLVRRATQEERIKRTVNSTPKLSHVRPAVSK